MRSWKVCGAPHIPIGWGSSLEDLKTRVGVGASIFYICTGSMLEAFDDRFTSCNLNYVLVISCRMSRMGRNLQLFLVHNSDEEGKKKKKKIPRRGGGVARDMVMSKGLQGISSSGQIHDYFSTKGIEPFQTSLSSFLAEETTCSISPAS